MPGYDKWKTRSPDDERDDEYENPTPEQERADYEDKMQRQILTELDIAALCGGTYGRRR